ncbi:LytTR family DNA-binding domain-containing protein [Lacihabitans sp. LS3-19]|uniref:LytR/AlgR family response regulator transcription factor n=1 Tax=Lacihabitans sp. LS3-19 TaxID=2487335 RepID=UPI0020CC044A|nr:LytTR family DNA-binding domain-containing protein [Lacihabitans sp. LS3-19]
MENLIHIGGRQNVNPFELITLKGDVNYTTVHFQNGKNKIIVATTLKKIQAQLEPFPNFFRVTKSTIINTDCIKKVKDNQIFLNNGEKIIPSRRRTKSFLGHLEGLKKLD